MLSLRTKDIGKAGDNYGSRVGIIIRARCRDAKPYLPFVVIRPSSAFIG